MYREWNKIEFHIWIWEKQDWEVDQEIDGKMRVRKDGRIVGGEGWQEKVHNREEWKKLLRTARNRCILHVPVEWMNMTHDIKLLPRCKWDLNWSGILQCSQSQKGGDLITWFSELCISNKNTDWYVKIITLSDNYYQSCPFSSFKTQLIHQHIWTLYLMIDVAHSSET